MTAEATLVISSRTSSNMDEAESSFVERSYVQVEYIDDVWSAYAWADVVVSRAGSNVLCELLVLGKSCVFIPMSTGRGDQIENAEEAKKYGATVISEKDLTPKLLANAINCVKPIEPVLKLNGTDEIARIIKEFVSPN